MEDLVTVIIPVYNVEKYLERCIESVINQSYRKIEIILIDDGSEDNSTRICKEYTNKDNRIRFMHQENKGVSAARNLGIDSATGKYICFVDSDDYVKKDYVLYMLTNLKKTDSDLSICVPLIEVCKGKWKIHSLEENRYFNREEGLISLFSRRGMHGGPYCKLYKTDILSRYHIRFQEDVKISEDNLFCYEYLRRCNKVYYSSQDLYYYCMNMASASNKKYIPKNINDSQLHFRAYWEIEKTVRNEESRVVRYYLTMMSSKCIRLVYKYNLFKYLSEEEIQYIRSCIKEAYEKGERSELRIKKGSYILGRIILVSPALARVVCETRRLYKKRI